MQKSLTEQNWEKLSVLIIKVSLMQWNLVTLHFWPDCCTTLSALYGLGRICSQYTGGWQWPSDFHFLSSAALPAPIAWLVTTDILFSALEISTLKSFRFKRLRVWISKVHSLTTIPIWDLYYIQAVFLFFTSNTSGRNLCFKFLMFCWEIFHSGLYSIFISTLVRPWFNPRCVHG